MSGEKKASRDGSNGWAVEKLSDALDGCALCGVGKIVDVGDTEDPLAPTVLFGHEEAAGYELDVFQ